MGRNKYYCECCGDLLFNKRSNSKFCSKCRDIRTIVKQYMINNYEGIELQKFELKYLIQKDLVVKKTKVKNNGL